MQYPKWIYSLEGAKLIETEDEHPGEGWFESPVEVPGPEFIEPDFSEPAKRKPGRPKKVSE